MNTRLILTISLLSGLVGGLVSHYAFPVTAYAQPPAPAPMSPVPNEIRAQNFVLVDDHNRVVGTITSSNRSIIQPRQEPTIVILDREQHEVWRASGAFTLRQLAEY